MDQRFPILKIIPTATFSPEPRLGQAQALPPSFEKNAGSQSRRNFDRFSGTQEKLAVSGSSRKHEEAPFHILKEALCPSVH
jgi:hypothetical protein